MPASARPPRKPLPRWVGRAGLGLLALLAMLVGLLPRAPAPPPSPEEPETVLVDRVGLLPRDVARDTNAWLQARDRFEAVLWLDARPPAGALEAWTTQTAIAWGVGQARQDRGLAIFVFRDAGVARIEVGYGLEGQLPDAWLRQMLQATLVPAFERYDWQAGIGAMLEALQQRLQADPAAQAGAPAPRPAAWARVWADAWAYGGRLLPALARHFHQADRLERVVMLAFALPVLWFGFSALAVAAATLAMLAKVPGWARALRQASAGKPEGADLPPLLREAGPRWGPLVMALPIAGGAFVSLMLAALAAFVFSLAPDRLTRQGQYGGGGVTVSWPAPAAR
jgi:uncharacterized protein